MTTPTTRAIGDEAGGAGSTVGGEGGQIVAPGSTNCGALRGGGLDAYLTTRSDRCRHCYHVDLQGCELCGVALKFKGQAQTTAARSADRQRVDSAIRQLAATGREFSSNDARPLHNVVGPVVGAAFTAAARAGLIKRTGYEASTQPGTHAHPVATWKGIAA